MSIVIRVSETQSLAAAKAGWSGDQLRLYVHLKRRLVLNVTWEMMRGTCPAGHLPQWLHGVSLTAWIESAGDSVRIIVMSAGFEGDDPPGGEPNPASTLHTTDRMAFLLHRQMGGMWWLEQIHGEPLFEPGDTGVPNSRLELDLCVLGYSLSFKLRDSKNVDDEAAWLHFMVHAISVARARSVTRAEKLGKFTRTECSVGDGRVRKTAQKIDIGKTLASATEKRAHLIGTHLMRGKSVARSGIAVVRNNVLRGSRAVRPAASMADRVAAAIMSAPIVPVSHGLDVEVPKSLENAPSHGRSSRAAGIRGCWIVERAAVPAAGNPVFIQGGVRKWRGHAGICVDVWRYGSLDGAPELHCAEPQLQ